jgi:hypothetical protein
MVATVKTLLGGAVGALALGREVAGHAVWWLRYQVDGTAREDTAHPTGDEPPPTD